MTEEKHIGSADPFADDFNWFKFLALPVEEITEEALLEASGLSGEWVTCACGQLCKKLPRHVNNAPIDETLYRLGLIFVSKISEAYNIKALGWGEGRIKNHLKEAKEILIQIEQRTNQLLNELQSN